MITGDYARTANAIAAQVGIDRMLAEVLSEGRVAEVRRLQAQGQLQNLGWAFGYNLAALPLAALGLLNPVIAAAALGISSVSVVSNSVRLFRFKA